MNTAPDAPEEAPETPPVGRWRTVLGRRWVLWTGAAVLGAALVTTAVVVPLAVAAAERAAAVDTWKTSLTEAFAASDTYVAAVTAHTEQVAAGTADVTAMNAILDALPPELVDPATTRNDVAAAAAALQAAASVEVPNSIVANLPAVPTPASTGDPTAVNEATADSSAAQLLDAAAGFRAQTADIDNKRKTLNDSTDAIETALENTRAPVTALITAAIAKAPTFPVDRAGEGERAAFTTALEALRPAAVVSDTTAVDVLPLVKGYVDALGAARASHDAVVAAEQEAQRQAQENTDNGSSDDRSSSNTGTSGSRSSNGGSANNNSNGGSGGGSSSGGSSSGGGASGGGSGGSGSSGDSSGNGSSGPVASPIKLVVSGSCVDFPNSGQSASYGSTLFMPADAAWHETYEIPGVGWGVRWSCF